MKLIKFSFKEGTTYIKYNQLITSTNKKLKGLIKYINTDSFFCYFFSFVNI